MTSEDEVERILLAEGVISPYFFDTSALVKRYAKEVGTAWVFSLVRPAAGNRLSTLFASPA